MSGLHDHSPLPDVTEDDPSTEDLDAVARHVLNWAARAGVGASSAAEVCEMLGIDPQDSYRRLRTLLRNEAV